MSTETKLTLDAPAGLLEDLEALDAPPAPTTTLPTREQWHPATLADVDWLLETMGRLDAEAAENQALADAATQRILARMDAANQRIQRRRDYLDGLARQYSAEHRKEIISGKAKSRALPNGTLAWRKTGGRLVRDEGPEADAALLAWAKAEGQRELVRVKEEPAWAEIQKYCAPQGLQFPLGGGPVQGHGQLIPPGTHWEEADEYGTLEVKPAGVALAKVSDN